MIDTRTKHDLSADTVRLDYQALIRTAAIAFMETREAVSRYLDELREMEISNVSRSMTANWLADKADALAVAAETYSTLVGGKTRSHVDIMNKPKVDE